MGSSRRGSPSRVSCRWSRSRRSPGRNTRCIRSTRTRSLSSTTVRRKLGEQNSLVRRLEKLEKRKKEREWKSTGLEKQAEFAQDVIDYYEELASRLEREYGAITNPDLKDFVSKGEKAVCDRLHLLKIADRFGWKGATDFEEELGRNEKEEKLLLLYVT